MARPYLLHTHCVSTHRLQLFAGFEKFRVIVLGGDGSIGWVLSAMDKYNLHSKVCAVNAACTCDFAQHSEVL